MANILIVYASMSGNTEEMAELIAEGVQAAGETVDVKSVVELKAADMLSYDGILLGAYTWGDGELPDEFIDFYEDMDDLDLAGKKVAVFGSGDTSYADFCAAVDILEEKAKERGAELTLSGLKIELSPEGGDRDKCRTFGKEFAQKLVAAL
jgi:flavodoxin I